MGDSVHQQSKAIHSNHPIPIRVNQKYIIITFYSNCHFLYKFDINLNNKKHTVFFWSDPTVYCLCHTSKKPSDPTTSSTWEAMNSEGFNAALMSIVQCLAALLFENGLKRKLWQCFCWPNLGRTWPNCYWVFVFVCFCLLLGLGDVDTKEVLGGWKVTTCNVLVVLYVVCFRDSNEVWGRLATKAIHSTVSFACRKRETIKHPNIQCRCIWTIISIIVMKQWSNKQHLQQRAPQYTKLARYDSQNLTFTV